MEWVTTVSLFISSATALYFPNAAVITRRDVGRQLSLNLSGNVVAYGAYNYQSAADDNYGLRVRVVSSGGSLNLVNFSTKTESTGLLTPTNLAAPITIYNDNMSGNSTDFVLYFVQTSVTPIFPVYTLTNGSITVNSDVTINQTHGVTVLNAKPSLLANHFALRSLPSVRVASCGFDSAKNEDYALFDVTAARQSFSFYVLNGPIATFFDPSTQNVSFSFTLTEATTLDRPAPPGAEFAITSAGYATVNASYSVEPGQTLQQTYDFGKDTLTQIVIDASDFRDGEKIRFIASGNKKSVDVSINTTDTVYEPDVYATTLTVTVTGNDTSHSPRFRIRVVSDAPSRSLFIALALFALHHV